MAAVADYDGREQSWVKHYILEHYLKRFARIIGSWCDSITYVDCFSGPWQSRTADLSDTSFAIALRELREAKRTVSEIWKRNLSIRCLFLERDTSAFTQLETYANQQYDAVVVAQNSNLSDAIPDIIEFVEEGGPKSFPFFFIDPTGWSGFDLDTIRPLLLRRPGEVLINFMTEHIRRFASDERPEVQESFRRLFGSDEYRKRLEILSDTQDRDDELVRCYAEQVRAVGEFSHTCTAIILHPNIDRTYFHLVYATRSRRGVEVFKETEENALREQETLRDELAEKERVKQTGMLSMFAECEGTAISRRVSEMRTKYLDNCRNSIASLLSSKKQVEYETIWDMAMSYPLVWQRDLKAWIQEWETDESCRILNRAPSERTPKIEQEPPHIVEWLR